MKYLPGAAALAVVAMSLVACATGGNDTDIGSLEALQMHERNEALVIDVRPAKERHVGMPRRPVVHLPFGSERSINEATVEAELEFVQRVRANLVGSRLVLLVCQIGVRSAAAARLLRRHGIDARSVRDGYMGNESGPGWKAWD